MKKKKKKKQQKSCFTLNEPCNGLFTLNERSEFTLNERSEFTLYDSYKLQEDYLFD